MFARLLALLAHLKAGAVGGLLVTGLTGALMSASLADGVAAVTLTEVSPTTASVVVPGPANNLTCAFSPSTIANDGGASTSTATVTIRDASAKEVSEGRYSITFSRTSGSSTALETTNPQTTSGGRTTFTVRSTTTAGTDTYTAAITAGTTPTLPNPTSPPCSISTQTVRPVEPAACAAALRSLDASFQRYRAALHERPTDKRARQAAKHLVKQADDLLKGIRKTAKRVLRGLGCRADDHESALDLNLLLSGTDPLSIAREADLAMSLVTNWARGALGLPPLSPGLPGASLTPQPDQNKHKEKQKIKHQGGSVSNSDGSEDSD